jgi:plastocyanin
MSDFAYGPAEIAVAKGAEVTISIANVAAFGKHDLLIVSGVFSELVEAKRAIVVAESGLVKAGESGSVVVTFDEPGAYQYFCTVTGHFVAGMQGTITVEG